MRQLNRSFGDIWSSLHLIGGIGAGLLGFSIEFFIIFIATFEVLEQTIIKSYLKGNSDSFGKAESMRNILGDIFFNLTGYLIGLSLF